MTDDLRGLVRAAVVQQAAAADQEFPYSPDVAGRFRRDIRRRRTAGATLLAVGGLAVATLATLGMGIWDGTPAPPAVTHAPTPTPNASPSPDWATRPLVDPADPDLIWLDGGPAAVPLECGSPTPEWSDPLMDLGWIVTLTDAAPTPDTPIDVFTSLGIGFQQGVEPYVVEHDAVPATVAVRDGVVVATAPGDPTRVRELPLAQGGLPRELVIELTACDGSPLEYGRYDLYVVDRLVVYRTGPSSGSPFPADAAEPRALLAVSTPVAVVLDVLDEHSALTPLDVGGSYLAAAQALRRGVDDTATITGGTTITDLTTTRPACGPAPVLDVFAPGVRGGSWWLREDVAPQQLVWEDGTDSTAALGTAQALTLNRNWRGADGTDLEWPLPSAWYLLDDAGAVVATGEGEPLDVGRVVGDEDLRRITVPIVGCEEAQVPSGAYHVLWAGSSSYNRDLWPSIRGELGLGNVALPEVLYSYVVIGDITVP